MTTLRIGRFIPGQCQIAECERGAKIEISVSRYRSAVAPGKFKFVFKLCRHHWAVWQYHEKELGEIKSAREYTRFT